MFNVLHGVLIPVIEIVQQQYYPVFQLFNLLSVLLVLHPHSFQLILILLISNFAVDHLSWEFTHDLSDFLMLILVRLDDSIAPSLLEL